MDNLNLRLTNLEDLGWTAIIIPHSDWPDDAIESMRSAITGLPFITGDRSLEQCILRFTIKTKGDIFEIDRRSYDLRDIGQQEPLVTLIAKAIVKARQR